MKPNRIILVRHGESEGNADKHQYRTIPDYALMLTPRGIEQARQAGKEIKGIIAGAVVPLPNDDPLAPDRRFWLRGP